jgi:hypothetical protein
MLFLSTIIKMYSCNIWDNIFQSNRPKIDFPSEFSLILKPENE